MNNEIDHFAEPIYPRNIYIDSMTTCCETFRAALRMGIDNEAYGLLIGPDGPDYDFPQKHVTSSGWYMGSDLPLISKCPWCYSDLTLPTDRDFKELT